MRKRTSFACLFAFGLLLVGCRSDERPIHPTTAPTMRVNTPPPPRIFCDHGEVRALSWSISSLLITNASIKPREQLTLVLETARDTFKVPLKRSGSRPEDPFSVDPKYVDILLPREGEGVIEVVRPDGTFAAFCGVGVRFSMHPYY
jgi:hypothetical protein